MPLYEKTMVPAAVVVAMNGKGKRAFVSITTAEAPTTAETPATPATTQTVRMEGSIYLEVLTKKVICWAPPTIKKPMNCRWGPCHPLEEIL